MGVLADGRVWLEVALPDKPEATRLALLSTVGEVLWRRDYLECRSIDAVHEMYDGHLLVYYSYDESAGVSLISADGNCVFDFLPGSTRVVGVSVRWHRIVFGGHLDTGPYPKIRRGGSPIAVSAESQITSFGLEPVSVSEADLSVGEYAVYADDDYLLTVAPGHDHSRLVSRSIEDFAIVWSRDIPDSAPLFKVLFADTAGRVVGCVRYGQERQYFDVASGMSIDLRVPARAWGIAAVDSGLVTLSTTREADAVTGLRCWQLDVLDQTGAIAAHYPLPIRTEARGLHVVDRYVVVCGLHLPSGITGTAIARLPGADAQGSALVVLEGRWSLLGERGGVLTMIGSQFGELVVGELDIRAAYVAGCKEELEW
jgi:hypothetical protein